MESTIRLAVGRLEIDWGKNHVINNYNALFQASDINRVPYYYFDSDDDALVVEHKEGLSKPFCQVIERVNLLGYTTTYAEREFEQVLARARVDPSKFSFDEFSRALSVTDVNAVEFHDSAYDDWGDLFRHHLFNALGLKDRVADPQYVAKEVGKALENLSAYCILQLLARNPVARGMAVTWQCVDLEENGWGKREQFISPPEQADRFLIVTEGSSDAAIIKHALKILKPHLSDFFEFVDMNEGYPFSGTGSLFNFLKGLIGISIQNNVIVIYDNDAEGVFNFNRSVRLKMPSNMRVLKLPDLNVFTQFRTDGPTGEIVADINGRGAAIECYLDVGSSALVRWTSFNKELGVWQGELVSKREAMTTFFTLSGKAEGYNFSGIEAVVDMIVEACVGIRERARLQELDSEFPLV